MFFFQTFCLGRFYWNSCFIFKLFHFAVFRCVPHPLQCVEHGPLGEDTEASPGSGEHGTVAYCQAGAGVQDHLQCCRIMQR